MCLNTGIIPLQVEISISLVVLSSSRARCPSSWESFICLGEWGRTRAIPVEQSRRGRVDSNRGLNSPSILEDTRQHDLTFQAIVSIVRLEEQALLCQITSSIGELTGN